MTNPKQTEPTDAMVEAAAKRMFARRMEAEKANHSTWAWRYQVQREELLLDAKAALTAAQNAQKSERVEALEEAWIPMKSNPPPPDEARGDG